MLPFSISLSSRPLLFPSLTDPHLFEFPTTTTNPTTSNTASPKLFLSKRTYTHRYRYRYRSSPSPYSSNSSDSTFLGDDDDGGADIDNNYSANSLLDSELESSDGIEIEIEKLGSNSRRIRSRIAIDATLLTIWNILTDYERLAEFIPGLALCQLIEKRDNFARLFQIGQQDLAFGLKFNAKGIVDCYEKDLESLPSGQRRDIEFKMIEGDFQIFEGRWSIEQFNNGRFEGSDPSVSQEFHTTLSYRVDVKPKLWLPVRLVEGRVCQEIKVNLSCIRKEAEKASQNTLPVH